MTREKSVFKGSMSIAKGSESVLTASESKAKGSGAVFKGSESIATYKNLYFQSLSLWQQDQNFIYRL